MYSGSYVCLCTLGTCRGTYVSVRYVIGIGQPVIRDIEKMIYDWTVSSWWAPASAAGVGARHHRCLFIACPLRPQNVCVIWRKCAGNSRCEVYYGLSLKGAECLLKLRRSRWRDFVSVCCPVGLAGELPNWVLFALYFLPEDRCIWWFPDWPLMFTPWTLCCAFSRVASVCTIWWWSPYFCHIGCD